VIGLPPHPVRRPSSWLPAVLAAATTALPAAGGVHYSGDQFRPLPARWNGFLPDLRHLRSPAGPLHDRYAAAARELERVPAPTADQLADLGALHLRLNRPADALAVLRPAARRFPDHFRLAANLGTAWQRVGDLPRAAEALDDAVRLAPPELRATEELHRSLVRLRLAERGRVPATPDALFPSPPPADAVGRVQGLLLSLPDDGRLLWLLGELAAEAGEVRTAAAILDGCVAEFGLGWPAVRARRQALQRQAADAEAAGHAPPSRLAFRSPRAFVRLVDPARLPPPTAGLNPLPWAVLGETEIDSRGRPTFLPYLDRLDGRRVELTGFVTPIGTAEPTAGVFLLTEAAVGCWFCEVPGPTQAVRVELPDGVAVAAPRGAVRVTGTLRLARGDPEGLPVMVVGAAVRPAD
jgi:hypothetical protein